MIDGTGLLTKTSPMTPLRRVASIIGAVALLGAVAAPDGFRKATLVHVRGGLACTDDGLVGPPTYSIDQLGNPGVPLVSPASRKLIKKVRYYTKSRALRFVFASGSDELVVFNATASDMCDPTSPPFFDLIGGCNEYYSPLNVTNAISVATSCDEPPRPWLASEWQRGPNRWPIQVHGH